MSSFHAIISCFNFLFTFQEDPHREVDLSGSVQGTIGLLLVQGTDCPATHRLQMSGVLKICDVNCLLFCVMSVIQL